MQNKGWPILKPGDQVDLIAPASRLTSEQLLEIVELLKSWQLQVKVAPTIFGDDLLCANSDAARLHHLQQALFNPHSKAIICARGGYGSMRLIPELLKLIPPATNKLFVGMSDITALQLFLQQQWHWPTLHGHLAVSKLTESSIMSCKKIILGEIDELSFKIIEPLNALAAQEKTIVGAIIGGNLCLVQASIGTAWQLAAKNRIILLEEVNERGYRVDRMLEQLWQAGIFKQAQAVIFGDFIGGAEADGKSLIKPVLQRFAERISLPVLQISGIGHGKVNQPVPLGVPAKLKLGAQQLLTIKLS